MSALLTFEGIEKRFEMPSSFLQRAKPMLYALRGVSAEVQKGETFCVVGESGCGKTTLGRVIMGLLDPNAGSVHFEGARLDTMTRQARQPFRRRMGMIFQNPYASLNPRHAISAALEEPLRLHFPGLSRAEAREKIDEALISVGADPGWSARRPHEFSGGQRQRISIARALVTDPDFIVADEPISALDVSIQAQVLNVLIKAREARGLTLFFITHDLSVVEHFGDRVAVMYLGEIVELASTRALFAAPRHPYTRLLLEAIPRIDGKPRERAAAPGELPDPTKPPKGCAFASRCPLVQPRCLQERPALRPVGEAMVACHAA